MHLVQTLSRGVADDVDLYGWLYDRVFPFESSLSEEDAYLSALLGCIEMVRTGTTCFADPGGNWIESGPRAIEQVGLRGVIAWRGVDTTVDEKRPIATPVRASDEEVVARNESLFKRFNGAAQGKIRVWFGLADCRAASEKLIVNTVDKARELGTGVEIHIAGTEECVRHVIEHQGTTEIKYLQRLGVLGPDLLIIHAGWITTEEVPIIKEHDVKACHCPGASMHGAYGSCSQGKFPELLEAGVTVALGVDSATANNSLDMFRAMYQAATCHKEMRLDPSLISPEQALEMATINGARALRWQDELGSLDVGKKADVIIVDASRPHWLPRQDFSMVPNLVYSASGADVDTVIIDGVIVMEDREMKTVDEERFLAEVQKAGRQVLKRAGLEDKLRPRWPVY
jgi:5-methylthioadenosine/S-adenosylhomocysteine deaminase